MWRLQQNVQYTKRRFFRDIVLFVIFCHIALFTLFIVIYNQTKAQHHFVVSPKTAYSTVVLMPLKKKVPQTSKSTTPKKSSKLKKVMSYKDYQKKVKAKKQVLKKSVAKKKVKPKVHKKTTVKKTVAKPVAKKTVSKKTTVHKAKPIIKKSSKKSATMLKKEVVKKTVVPKKTVPPVVKKEAPAVRPPQKIDKPQKTPIAQTKEVEKSIEKPKEVPAKPAKNKQSEPIEKKEAPVEKKVEAEKIVEQKNTASEVEKAEKVVVEEVVEQPAKPKTEAVEEVDLENVTFVGRHDLELLQTEEVIQQEIMKYWKPPVGITKDKVCLMLVRVDKKGHARSIKVKKSSGSMANDMCARAALLKVSYPQAVWGQEITVTLGQ